MKKFELFIPWLLVCVAMVGSLFFSETKHEEPCTLCWYQRVILFPLVIILGIAAFRNAYRIILYVLPLTLIGVVIAAIHVTMIGFFAHNSFCPTCTLKFNSEGPPTPVSITLPFLSLLTFIFLNVLLIWIYRKHIKSKKL